MKGRVMQSLVKVGPERRRAKIRHVKEASLTAEVTPVGRATASAQPTG